MVEAGNKLNTRQRAFAEAYSIPGTETYGNAKQSAIKAGYSEKSAEVTGSKLLRNAKVSAYLRGVQEKLFDENIMSGKEVLYQLSRTARGEEIEEEPIVTKTGEFVEHPETGNLVLVYNERIHMVKRTPKISDRVRSRELLGKHHKLWTEKTEIEHSGAVQFVDDIE